MAFIGNNLGNVLTEAKTIDTIVGDGVNTTLTISTTPGSVNNVEVYYDGIFQSPSEDFTLLGNILTFTSAPPLGVAVVVLSGNDSQVVYPKSNTISSAKILDNVIESSKINDIAVDKVSGILPALNGEAITGLNMPAAVDVTTSSANPTVTANKPLGSLWVNSTTGDMFIETDATVDQNTWINVGSGTGDVRLNKGGTQFGWAIGGVYDTAPQTYTDRIEKFSYTSDANSTDIANLAVTIGYGAGHSSYTHGYISGGRASGVTASTRIEKFAFSSTTNATKIGDRTVVGYGAGGCNSSTHGYTVGSDATPFNTIDKFSFATDGDSTDVGDLIHIAGYAIDCTQSITHGYSCGGAFPAVNIIAKWNFQGSFTITDVGNLITVIHWPACFHSETHGYSAGGHDGSNRVNRIDKFFFCIRW